MIDATAVVLKATIITTNAIETIIIVMITEDGTLMGEGIDGIVEEEEEIDGRVDRGKPVCFSVNTQNVIDKSRKKSTRLKSFILLHIQGAW
jgi:hypothetical protein